MDLYRFYCPTLQPGPLLLPEDQTHHALHVLRLQSGVSVELFDGQGHFARGTLETTKRTASVTIKKVEFSPPPRISLSIATAVPKADRAEWLIEQCSQLNAHAVQWLESDRGVVRPREGGGKMDKFQRLAIESAKQCGRNTVLRVNPMRPVVPVMDEAKNREDFLWWLEPREGVPISEAVKCLPQSGPVGITALIGPEGGWSDAELAALAATMGIQRVRLSPTILRIETACAAVAALTSVLS